MLKEITKRRVVITGAGLVTPLGRNCDETFDKAAQGCSGIDYITAFDTAGLPCRISGQVDDSWVEGHEGTWQRARSYSEGKIPLLPAPDHLSHVMGGLAD